MKRYLAFLLLVIILFLSFTIPRVYADDSGTVDFIFDTYSKTIQVADNFDLTISVQSESATQNISALGFAVVYDSAKLQFVGRTILEDSLTWSDVSEQAMSGTLKKVLFTANASSGGYALGTSPVNMVKLTFKGLTSGTTNVYLIYSDDRNSYDNYTSAVLLGETTDVSDHTFSDQNSPLVVTINSNSSGDNSSGGNNNGVDSGNGGSGSNSGNSSPYPNTGIFDNLVVAVGLGSAFVLFGFLASWYYRKSGEYFLDRAYRSIYGREEN